MRALVGAGGLDTPGCPCGLLTVARGDLNPAPSSERGVLVEGKRTLSLKLRGDWARPDKVCKSVGLDPHLMPLVGFVNCNALGGLVLKARGTEPTPS